MSRRDRFVTRTPTPVEATRQQPTLLTRLVCWARAAAARRRVRARLREDLSRMDTHLLRDIGVRREDLLCEAYRPFWRE